MHYVHKQTHSTDKKYKCLICSARFNTCAKLCRHKVTHLNLPASARHRIRKKTKKCPQCDKLFRADDGLKAHLLKNHSTEEATQIIPCNYCSRTYTHLFLLERHVKTSHNEKPHVKCDYCSNVYKRRSSLNYHLRTTHNVDSNQPITFTCTICNKIFAHKDNLTRHYKLHKNEKDFKCNVCGKCFAQSGNLKAHMNTHSNLKPFVCECGKRFNQKSNLNTHRKKKCC